MINRIAPPKKVIAIHDMSCVGRCALTIIIPAMSVMGVQVCPMPTAVLSTHTGGYTGFTFRDLTGDMREVFKHWKALDMDFDCVYSGFLGSAEQIEIVSDIFDALPDTALKICDPVMGDDGALYSTYTAEMQEKMRNIVGKATIITPNFTECCFLLGRPHHENTLTEDTIKKYLTELGELGAQISIITGVKLYPGKLTNCAYDKNTGEYSFVSCDKLPQGYPGTGDLFCSVLTACLMNGKTLGQAIEIATEYLYKTIEHTIQAGTPVREGVLFEHTLHWLTAK